MIIQEAKQQTSSGARPRRNMAERPPLRHVHLGLGAFFRAHGASYFSELGRWGIVGVSLRSADVRDRLVPQDCVYTAVERSAEGEERQQIEVLRDVLVAPEDPEAVLRAMVDPAVELVSLTITEKGYCHDPATGEVNLDHPDICHDLMADLPKTAPGFLVAALRRRRDAGVPPFAVLSCDNLPLNGRVIQSAVLAMANEVDPELADWIAANGAFPSTMVDRIVPATLPEDVDGLVKDTGIYDPAMVVHEPFRQWVIEDQFGALSRPDLGPLGVQFVPDILPFEQMKLRMLNGGHSALVYLGLLVGHETVSDCMADPVLANFLRALWSEEIAPTVSALPGGDLARYSDILIKRFSNPAIEHSILQISMDGSQKLPQRILAPLSERSKMGVEPNGLLLVVAGWMRFVAGKAEDGTLIQLHDPLASALKASIRTDPGETVANLLDISEIFTPRPGAATQAKLTELYQGLGQVGARAMMRKVLE